MQIVIDISENSWEEIQNTATTDPDSMNWYERKISEGTPLPEGHGDLIDRNELLKQPIDTANYPSNYVRLAKAIIEADKEESEG